MVPDGIVGFFTSYLYMEEVIKTWNEMGILQKVSFDGGSKKINEESTEKNSVFVFFLN